MIFLTVGTHQPFDRLVRCVDDWVAASGHPEVFGQITDPGAQGYRPRHFEWVARIAPDEYARRVRAADFLVAHAGTGSIIAALTWGKPVAMLPRRARLGEMRNDHQVATAERFRAKPGLFVAMTEAELPPLLDGLLQATRTGAGPAPVAAISPFAEDRLIAALRGVIDPR